jgi:hypothetical protein
MQIEQMEILETGASYAILKWSKPELDNGAIITNFKIRYFSAGDEKNALELETEGCDCEYRCVELQPGTAYFFTVCAQNAAGWGQWLSPNAYGLTKSAPPGRPERFRVIGSTDKSVRLGWAPPMTNGSAIVLYEIAYEDGSGRNCSSVRPPSDLFGGILGGEDVAAGEEWMELTGVAAGSLLSAIQVPTLVIFPLFQHRLRITAPSFSRRLSVPPSQVSVSLRGSGLAGSGEEPCGLGAFQRDGFCGDCGTACRLGA